MCSFKRMGMKTLTFTMKCNGFVPNSRYWQHNSKPHNSHSSESWLNITKLSTQQSGRQYIY
jgi:hypothetical protein